jgi:sugar phosphate isomerase/epimerase
MRFGISTHLFHDVRLARDHLRLVAEHGFDTIELFASRAHFDYHSADAASALAGWLDETGVQLHSVHAPIADSLVSGVWGRPWSTAAADARSRAEAVDESLAAIGLARTVPYGQLIVHLGVPAGIPGAALNQRDAARRSFETIGGRAADAGVQVALEVIPNDLSSPAALVRLFDEDLEVDNAGICLDLGHAHLLGDVVDAVETVSGWVSTTHVHDNRGKTDEHLLPFEGTIDWAGTMLALQKVGYDGVLMFEPAGATDPVPVLRKAAKARERLRALLES